MPGIPYKYAETFARLRRATEQLHQMMESGEFYSLGYIQRRKLLRRVRRLYNKLAGPISPALIGTALATAGVLALAGCGPASDMVPSFGPAVSNPFSIDDTYPYPGIVGPTIADVDSAGDLDLVTVHAGQQQNRFWHNTGTTTSAVFSTGVADPNLGFYYSEGGPYFSGAALDFVDLDGDGDLDAVSAGRYSNGYNYYGAFWQHNTPAGEGNPAFDTPEVLFAWPDASPYTRISSLTMADIDEDGDQDMLFVTNTYGDQDVYFSRNDVVGGLPTFPTQVLLNDAGWGFTGDFYSHTIHSVEAADLDGDGDVDLLIGAYYHYPYSESGEARIFHFENTGTPASPSFGFPQINSFGLVPPTNKNWGQSYLSYGAGLGIATGDLDGDGDLDLILGPYTQWNASNYDSEFFYFENEPIEVEVEEPAASARTIL